MTGKLGTPSGPGDFYVGWSEVGDYCEEAGIYHRQKIGKKIMCLRIRHNWPKNPRSVAQTALRDKFKAGCSAWNALTTENKAKYTRARYPVHATGFNRFMKEYLS
jgi:predicted glycosyl hydrolase (DUF1957 family)